VEGFPMKSIRNFFFHTLTIAQDCFLDLFRQRILYNIFFVSLFLLFFGYLAALLVFGHQDRVMLHFGTMVNALSVFFVAAGAGARSIRNEVEQRTAYLPLSRPISRTSYYYGKWLGISLFTFLNTLLLTLVLVFGLYLTGGHANLAFVQSAVLIWCETLLVSSLSLLLSLYLRQGLSAMVCMAYLFLGHNHDQMDFLKAQGSEGGGIFSFIKWVTPNTQALLMDTRAFYDSPLTAVEFSQRFGYGFMWALFFLLIGNALFYRKNL
jgi:hypothetical protein